jgi:DNA-binding transcriptional LysR family regulator
VVIERLATDPIMVALPADHPLAGDDTLALSQLRGQPRVG